MLRPYFDIQSMPNITSNPCDSKIIRSDGKTWLPMVKGIRSHHRLAIYSAPGELTNRGVLRAWVGSLNLSTNPLDMYECDAPVSKRTRAVKDLTKNLPITASGYPSTSSTLTWFACPLLKGLGFFPELPLPFLFLASGHSLA